jgi:opacity protein-like surface antigen
MREFRKLAYGLAGLLAISGSAAAADLLAPEETTVVTESGWTFTLAPYLWAAGLQGDIGVSDSLPEVNVDLSFMDILKHFDIGFMGAAEARYGRFGVLTDLLYLKVSGDDDVNPEGPIDANIELTSKTLTSLGALEYRLIDEEGGTLDALAGVRVWWLDNEIDYSGQVINASADVSESWVDPTIGLRGRFNLSPEFYFTGWGMIGGFGVSSKFAWDALGGLGYDVSDSVSLIAGYRGLGVDYRNDGFVFDVVMHGPILGLTWTF